MCSTRVCDACGGQVNRGGTKAIVYCCKECWRVGSNRRRKQSGVSCIPCTGCGGVVGKRSVTGLCLSCCAAHKNRSRRKISEAVCRLCKGVFLPRQSKHSTYCGRECAFLSRLSVDDAHPVAGGMHECLIMKRWRWIACSGCGVLQLGRRSKCDECQAEIERKRTREYYRSIPLDVRCCFKCERPLGPSRNRLCQGCRDVSRRAARKTMNARRRARKAGCIAERFDPFDVFIRDAMKCHACLGPCVMPTKKYNPMMATIDHIVPLAAGGAHSMSNAATCHSICNSMKRDLV